MSEELHIPHQHGVESGLAKWVAIFTAIVATMGGIVGHEASHVANDAILYKNEAVLKKTDAANQWAYYQAVSTKSHLMELATLVDLPWPTRGTTQGRYRLILDIRTFSTQ